MEDQTFHCILHGSLPASAESVVEKSQLHASLARLCDLLEEEANFLSSLYRRTLRKPSANIYSALFSRSFLAWIVLRANGPKCECESNAGLFHFCNWAGASPSRAAHFLH